MHPNRIQSMPHVGSGSDTSQVNPKTLREAIDQGHAADR